MVEQWSSKSLMWVQSYYPRRAYSFNLLVKRPFCMRNLWVRVPLGPFFGIDGRVVDCDDLLNHCTISTGGSNPPLSIYLRVFYFLCGGWYTR